MEYRVLGPLEVRDGEESRPLASSRSKNDEGPLRGPSSYQVTVCYFVTCR